MCDDAVMVMGAAPGGKTSLGLYAGGGGKLSAAGPAMGNNKTQLEFFQLHEALHVEGFR